MKLKENKQCLKMCKQQKRMLKKPYETIELLMNMLKFSLQGVE